MTLREFNDAHEHERWSGTSSAFRNGAKLRLTGGESNYLFRKDFQDAWRRGWKAMDEFLAAGGEVTL
jgi:hypothetical protein